MNVNSISKSHTHRTFCINSPFLLRSRCLKSFSTPSMPMWVPSIVSIQYCMSKFVNNFKHSLIFGLQMNFNYKHFARCLYNGIQKFLTQNQGSYFGFPWMCGSTTLSVCQGHIIWADKFTTTVGTLCTQLLTVWSEWQCRFATVWWVIT